MLVKTVKERGAKTDLVGWFAI